MQLVNILHLYYYDLKKMFSPLCTSRHPFRCSHFLKINTITIIAALIQFCIPDTFFLNCSMTFCFSFDVLMKLNPIQVNITGGGPSQ